MTTNRFLVPDSVFQARRSGRVLADAAFPPWLLDDPLFLAELGRLEPGEALAAGYVGQWPVIISRSGDGLVLERTADESTTVSVPAGLNGVVFGVRAGGFSRDASSPTFAVINGRQKANWSRLRRLIRAGV